MALRTATNPKTGERVAFVGGQWVPISRSATNSKTGTKAYFVNGQWITDEPAVAPAEPAAPKEESGFLRQAADIPVQAATGVATGIRLITDAFGADNPVSQKIRGAEDYLQSLLSAQAKDDQKEVARIMKEAEDKGVVDQVVAGLKAFSVAPIDTIAQAAGTVAPTIVGGLATAALRAPAVVGLVGTGATMGAGTIKSSIYDATYEVLREQGVSEKEAKEKAAEAQSYGGENLDQIVLGATIGGVAGRVGVEPIAARQIAGEITKRAVAKTAAKEAGTEFGQAFQEKTAENIALQRQGFDVPTFRGAVGAGTIEAVAGAGVGAGVELAGRREQAEAAPSVPTGEAPPPAPSTLERTAPEAPPAEPVPTKFTVQDLIDAPPKIAAEDAPENLRYEPFTMKEDQIEAEVTKMEDLQDQLAELLVDDERAASQAAVAQIPFDVFKQNLTNQFDQISTRLDIFNKFLDGELLPVKPNVTAEQATAVGVSPDVIKALNLQSAPAPAVTPPDIAPPPAAPNLSVPPPADMGAGVPPINTGVPDATTAAAPPITQTPDIAAVGGGASLPASGSPAAGLGSQRTLFSRMEPPAGVVGDVGDREETLRPALTKPDRISQRIIETGTGSDFVKNLYLPDPVDAVLTDFEDLETVTQEEIDQSKEYIKNISQNALRQQFGDEVTLYRGLKGTEDKFPVLSYSLDKDIAKFNAKQQGIRTGKIEEITVPVSEVLSYSTAIDGRNKGRFYEQEVIIPASARRVSATASEVSRSITPDTRAEEALRASLETLRRLAKSREAKKKFTPVDGPFTNAKGPVVSAKSVDPRLNDILSGWVNALQMGKIPGLNRAPLRIFLVTNQELSPKNRPLNEVLAELETNYGLGGKYSPINDIDEAKNKSVMGFTRPFATLSRQDNNVFDHIISYDGTLPEEVALEVIAHELGHVIERTAFYYAPEETRRAIVKDYRKWYVEQSANKKETLKLIRSTRAFATAAYWKSAMTNPADVTFTPEYVKYLTSFSEWFADQVSKWATTSEKPLSIVDKFFASLGRAFRSFVKLIREDINIYGRSTDFLPAKSVADFLDKMGPAEPSMFFGDIKDTVDRAGIPNISTKASLNAIGEGIKAQPKLNRRIYDTVRNILDTTTISDNIRSGFYAFLSLPQQVELFAKELPSLRSLLNLLNVRASALKARREVLDRNVRKWTDVIDEFDDATRAKFYEIAHESTRLQVEFRKDLNNPLTKRFEQLPDKLQKVYWEMLDSYQNMSAEYLKLVSKNLSRRAAMKLKREMAKKRLKVYLPLFREGDYWLRYQDAKNDTVVMSFNSNRERELAWADAVKNGAKESSKQVFARIEDAFKNRSVGPFFNKILDELEKRGVPQATKRALYGMYLDQIPADSVRQQYRQRARQDGSYGYKGYEMDLIKVYSTIASRMSNQLNNLEYVPEIDKVYADIESESKKEVAQSKGLAVNKLMENLDKQMDYLRDPGHSPLVNALSSFSYYWYIIGNISTAVINLTQLPMVVYPILTGKYGAADTAAAMKDATEQYFKGGWDNDDVPGGYKKFPSDYSFGIGLPKDSPLAKLYEAAIRQSAIRRSSGYDIVEGKKQTYGKRDYVGLKAKTEQILGWTFQNSERFNREVTLIAAFNLEMKKSGGDVAKSIQTAIETVTVSHGVTLTETSPRIFQTGFGKVAFTFKNFAQTMVYLQARLLRDAVRGESPEVKRLAAKQLLGIMGMAFVFAGVQGMPFYGAGTLLANLLADMFGDDDEPFSPEDNLRDSMSALTRKGVVNQLLMADVAARTGFSNLLWRDDEKRVEEVGPVLFAMEQIFGPSYAAGMGIYRGYKDWSEGHVDRAVESFLPSFLRNIMKSYRYSSEGALTRDKKPIYEDINEYEIFMQVLGFSPTELSQRTEIARARAKAIENAKNRKTALMDRYYMAKITKDRDALNEVREAISKYNDNESVKSLGMVIKPADLNKSVEERRRRAAQSTYGVYTPKKMQQALKERGLEGD